MSSSKCQAAPASIYAFVVLVAGCGTSQYNAQLTQRIADLERDAPFLQLTAPTEIAGTTVKLSVPKVLTRFITLETPDPAAPSVKISPERVIFLPLKVPGVYCAYDAEGELSDGSKSPMVCQIAVLPKAAVDVAAVAAKAFPGREIKWEQIEVDAPRGEKKIVWKHLRVDADMPFDVYPKDGGMMQFKNLPGILEVWWHETDDQLVVLTWRIPQEIDEKVKLIELAPRTAGTIVIGPPPAEPKANGEPAPDEKK